MKKKLFALVTLLLLAAAFTCSAGNDLATAIKNHWPGFGGGPRGGSSELVVITGVSSSNANITIEYFAVQDATLYVLDNEGTVVCLRGIYEGDYDRIKVPQMETGTLVAVSAEGQVSMWSIGAGK